MAIQKTSPTTGTVSKLFGGLTGEQFGGGSNYLQLEPGEQKGPFVHQRVEKDVKLSDDTEAIDLHVSLDADGNEIRMPASSVFRVNAAQANFGPGDEYHVARLPDTAKKSGRGKGRPMAVYAVLVSKRVSGNKPRSREEANELVHVQEKPAAKGKRS